MSDELFQMLTRKNAAAPSSRQILAAASTTFLYWPVAPCVISRVFSTSKARGQHASDSAGSSTCIKRCNLNEPVVEHAALESSVIRVHKKYICTTAQAANALLTQHLCVK